MNYYKTWSAVFQEATRDTHGSGAIVILKYLKCGDSPLWGLHRSRGVTVGHHDYSWPNVILRADESELVSQQKSQHSISKCPRWHSKAQVDGLIVLPSFQCLVCDSILFRIAQSSPSTVYLTESLVSFYAKM